MTDTVTLTLPDEVKKYADSAWAAIAEHARAKGYEWIAQSIEEQVKPAIEEPKEFGSIVRAGVDGLSDRVLWQRLCTGGWQSEEGASIASFGWLDHPEVLRVGIGTTQDAVGESYLEGRRKGAEVVVARGIRVLEAYHKGALTAERKDAYQNAINVLRELS